MRILTLALILLWTSSASAGEYLLKDSECKLLVSTDTSVVEVVPELAEYTCVTAGDEATCNYRNLKSGETQGKPTKYEVVQLGEKEVWSAPFGNIKMQIDNQKRTFAYAMVSVDPTNIILSSKHCAGKVIRMAR